MDFGLRSGSIRRLLSTATIRRTETERLAESRLRNSPERWFLLQPRGRQRRQKRQDLLAARSRAGAVTAR